MADPSDGEFDEALLNQPWDPVSYFDEEEPTAQDGNSEISSDTTYGKQLSALFETNLNSVENDLQRLAVRRYSQQNDDLEIGQSLGELENGDNPDKENYGSIDRFITYEDKEDHLKAVDNAFIINKKNIDDDIRRFAHFKQHSVEQNDIGDQSLTFKRNTEEFVSFDSGFSNEAACNVEEMINLMPDVVQDLPESPTEGLRNNESCFSDENGQRQEIDIDGVLPDVFSGELVDKSSIPESKNNIEPNPIDSTSNEGLLIDFDGSTNHDEEKIQNYAELFDLPVASVGSSESVNEVLMAAEAIVRDFGSPAEIVDFKSENIINESSSKEQIGHEQNLDLLGDANDGVTYGETETNITDTGISTPLVAVCDAGGDEGIDIANTSLHDELVSASPGHDFNEPNFNGSRALSRDVGESSLQGAMASSADQNLSGQSSVKKKTRSLSKKHHNKHKHSNKSQFIVQVMRTDNAVTSADSASDSDTSAQLEPSASENLSSQSSSSEPERLLHEHSMDLDLQNENDKLNTCPSPTSLMPDKNGTDAPQRLGVGLTEQSSGEKIGESLEHLESKNVDEGLCGSVTAVEDDQQNLQTPTNVVSEPDSTALLSDEILNITSEISHLLADEILNQNVEQTEHVVQNEDVFVESPVANEQSSEPEDQQEQLSRDHARSGSTSESEELEEFISQQLDAAVALSSEAPSSSIPVDISQQTAENIQLGWYAPKWIPDKETKGCMNCGIKFTVVKRRHHCRACGKVMCSNCCNMRAELPYLEYKPGRVCQACYTILSEAGSLLLPLPLMSGNQDVPGRGHTISLNDTDPGTPGATDSPPQYMPESPPEYSLTPGEAVQNGPPNPPSYFASSSSSSSSSSRISRSRTESDRSVVIMFNSSQTDLPPVLKIENEVVKIINNPNLKGLFLQMKDTEADPVAFLVNKNLVVKLKVISFDCCIGKQCWCFSSDGMGASNQEEIIFIVEYKGDDTRLLKCIFQQLNSIFERAKHGEPVSDLGFVSFDDYMLNDPKNVGMLLFKQTAQCVKNIFVPCHPHLFGIWVQQTEIPWAKNLPLRLLLRLGAEFKHYPCPIYNLQKRDPVYNVLGRTIVDLLADFRNFQYTLPRISGLLISVSKKETVIKLPQSRYDEVLKVLNVSEENVLAFCGNFNRKADSHLVCMESDGTYSTQTITCRSSSKKVTGCSFVVFSAALKQAPQNIQAKSSVVEDGVMVQVTAETMKKIRTSIKEMQDFVTTPDPESDQTSIETSRLRLVWGSSDDSTTRITSPIDGSAFDGLTNMRIRHSYDFTVSTSPAKIHWQEVYFLPNDADTVGRLSAKELSQMTSSVAKACMNALSPHLSTLVALQMTKIGLRISLDSDSVEYRIGSNKEQLPQELTGELDDKLIPVIHGVMKTVPHRRVSAELIFQIARIV